MRRTLVGAIVALVAVVVIPSAADADTPGCVSRREYDRVVAGMTAKRVHAIFDTAGAATGLGGSTPIRYYKTCSRLSQVQVTYSASNRVLSKSANWY